MDWFEDNDWNGNAQCDSLNKELFGSMLSETPSRSKEKKMKKRKRSNDTANETHNKISKSQTSFTISTPISSENTDKNIFTKQQKRRLKEKNRIKRKKEERLAYQATLSRKNTPNSVKESGKLNYSVEHHPEKANSKLKYKIPTKAHKGRPYLKHNNQKFFSLEDLTETNKHKCSEKYKERGKETEASHLESYSINAVTETKTSNKLLTNENIKQTGKKRKKKSSSKKNKYKHLVKAFNSNTCESCNDGSKTKERTKQLSEIDSSQALLKQNKHFQSSHSGFAESDLSKPEDNQNISRKKKKSKLKMKTEQNEMSKKKEIVLRKQRLKDQSNKWSSSEVNRNDSVLKSKKYIKEDVPSISKSKQIHENNPQREMSNRQLKKMSVQDRMKEKLDAARFRFLNEQLYTINGKEAFDLFCGDDDAFKIYHRGFQTQVYKWPVYPLNLIIKYIKNRPKNFIVADLGCGEAKLAQSVPQKVFSFDLVALNKYVTVCDIAKLPLKPDSVDIVVFCLSLMGTNLTDYLCEANRILKNGGIMKIAEVTSRFKKLNSFVRKVEKLGFVLLSKDTSNTMFIMMDFEKVSGVKKIESAISLEPCLYKRR